MFLYLLKIANSTNNHRINLLFEIERNVSNVLSSFSISLVFPSRVIHIQFGLKFCQKMITVVQIINVPWKPRAWSNRLWILWAMNFAMNKITFIEYLQSHNLQLLTFRLLHEVSLTAESELLLLNALMKWIKLVCLISILNIASTCALLLLLLLTVALFVLYPFCIDSLVSIYAISPLWFYEWQTKNNVMHISVETFIVRYQCFTIKMQDL